MAVVPVSLGLQSNPGRDSSISNAHLINCYAEDAGEEGKMRFPIYASDGFTEYSVLTGGGAIRAMLNFDEAKLYVASGSAVFRIWPTTGTATKIGDISATGMVSMARNRKSPNAQVAVSTSSGHFYIIENDVLTEVNLTSLGAGMLQSIVGMAGYFVLLFDNGEFFVTSIDEGTAIDDLEFAKAQDHPDGLVVGAVRGRDLCLFGDRSIEFWQNTGNTDFPFEPTTSASIGCYSARSVTEMVIAKDNASDSVAFAASDSNGAYVGIMLLSGYTGSKISTHAVDRAIRDEPDKSTIVGFSWAKDGHSFYCISGSSFSWVFDAVTGFWHERKSDGLGRWRITDAMSFDDNVIVGDYATNKLYKMRHDIHDENGVDLTMTVRMPAIHAWPNPMRFYSLLVDTISGVGLSSGDDGDTDPVLSMRHSNDGGVTWVGPRTAKVGKSGEKKKRVKYLQLGQSKEDGKVIELSMSANVVKGLIGAAVDAVTVKG